MEWRQIIGFYHVARLGSFTKAAEVTLRTQSAVSQQIKNIETELGCQLLERIGKRRLRLTSAGEKFFDFSKNVLEQFEILNEEINAAHDLNIGQLRLAASFTTLYHLFPSTIKRYMRRHPNIKLTIYDRSQQEILDLIKSGDVDFGVVLESYLSADFSAIKWLKVNTVLITPLDHALTKLKKVTIKQIGRYPLILPPPKLKHRSAIESKFEEAGIRHPVIMESSNVELSSRYVELGVGISFATIVHDLDPVASRSLAFIPLDHIFKPENIVVVMRKDKQLTAHKKAFINILLKTPLRSERRER